MCIVCAGLVFFFQAEDGIRDAQESRGLGDVYKRQQELMESEVRVEIKKWRNRRSNDANALLWAICNDTVSYTHLTLPTIYSV